MELTIGLFSRMFLKTAPFLQMIAFGIDKGCKSGVVAIYDIKIGFLRLLHG